MYIERCKKTCEKYLFVYVNKSVSYYNYCEAIIPL